MFLMDIFLLEGVVGLLLPPSPLVDPVTADPPSADEEEELVVPSLVV
jgi:hypothetical protein